MTKEELAETLNGREIGCEITTEESYIAKENGLVVVHGVSDDLFEFEGAICEEAGAPGTICFTKEGKVVEEDNDEVLDAIELLKENQYTVTPPVTNEIEAIFDTSWDSGEGDEPCSWKYETEIPHATFRIMEGNELYCVGIVFEIKSLK